MLNDIDFLKFKFSSLPDHVNRLRVSEWAEKHRILNHGPMKGPWRNDITPYSTEIMDCFSSSSDVKSVCVQKSAQIGITTGAIENVIGYHIDNAPTPILYVSSTDDLAKNFIETRIDGMIYSSGLQDKIFAQNTPNNRKSGSTAKRKDFIGGFLMAIGAKSPNKMRSISFQIILVDELDSIAAALGEEGDPISLLQGRTLAYGDSARLLYISTPLVKGTSHTEKLYLLGDQRKFFIPCIYCGEFQHLKFSSLKYEVNKETNVLDYDSVHYECEFCKKKLKNHDKVHFLKKGKWIPTAETKLQGHRSYHLNTLYSPVGMTTWERIIERWLEAKDDVDKLRAFTNTILGETWEERGEAPRYERIMKNRGTYFAGEIPEEVVFLTCGVDVQSDRLEAEITGWGKDQISYSIDYQIFEGDTSDANSKAWEKLARFFEKEYFTKESSKPLKVLMTFIDRGFLPDVVHKFCSVYAQAVYPSLGMNSKNIKSNFKKTRLKGRETDVVEINTNLYKDRLFSFLRKDKSVKDERLPNGWCWFPFDYDEKYFKMLTSEQKYKVRNKSGKVIRYEWRKPNNSVRNEALDCRVYSMCAADYLVYLISTEQIALENSDWNDSCEWLIKGL